MRGRFSINKGDELNCFGEEMKKIKICMISTIYGIQKKYIEYYDVLDSNMIYDL